MKILVVSATENEIQPTSKYLNQNGILISDKSYMLNNNIIDLIITGVGIANTIFALTTKLYSKSYDIIINVGIGGAFDKSVALGTVYLITRDRFGDLGVENADSSFSDIFEMGLLNGSQPPYKNGWLETEMNLINLSLPLAKAITVNTVSGVNSNIERIKEKYNPDIESMEGAGFMFVALMLNIPAIQIRSISNHIEPRNKSNWDISLAINNLNDVLLSIFTDKS